MFYVHVSFHLLSRVHPPLVNSIIKHPADAENTTALQYKGRKLSLKLFLGQIKENSKAVHNNAGGQMIVVQNSYIFGK